MKGLNEVIEEGSSLATSSTSIPVSTIIFSTILSSQAFIEDTTRGAVKGTASTAAAAPRGLKGGRKGSTSYSRMSIVTTE